jgi:pyruvate/2-oxoacid:ferredoxin oxidoreductase alpha subunit
VLGIRAYRPFPAQVLRDKLVGRKGVLVYDKAVSYGYAGPICTDVRAALYGEPGAPVVWGAVCGLGGRDVSPEQLADAALRALADGHAGMLHRPTDWINLKPTGGAQ